MFGANRRRVAEALAFDERVTAMDRETTDAHERILHALEMLALRLAARPPTEITRAAAPHGSNGHAPRRSE